VSRIEKRIQTSLKGSADLSTVPSSGGLWFNPAGSLAQDVLIPNSVPGYLNPDLPATTTKYPPFPNILGQISNNISQASVSLSTKADELQAKVDR
jgi:hypothetical protein